MVTTSNPCLPLARDAIALVDELLEDQHDPDDGPRNLSPKSDAQLRYEALRARLARAEAPSYRCAAPHCPGFPWRASDRPHPCRESGRDDRNLEATIVRAVLSAHLGVLKRWPTGQPSDYVTDFEIGEYSALEHCDDVAAVIQGFPFLEDERKQKQELRNLLGAAVLLMQLLREDERATVPPGFALELDQLIDRCEKLPKVTDA